jgi:sulfatase maturation enzyme AslB (radical SAM superfamily)
MHSNQVQLDWIDAFVARIRPFVHVRVNDRVLIRLPNQAFKLNRTGTRVLNHIIQGGSIKDILKARSYDENLPAQLHCFFTDLSRMLGSNICDAYHSPSIEKIPFDLGYIELPILSEIALTWKCNIKCRFCYAACRCICEPEEESTLEELSTKDAKHVLDIIRHDAEVPSVSFTGGEPVLRQDLIELIAYASSTLNMRVNLITNGTLISAQMANDFRAAGLASAQVSIESPDPDVHNCIVGVKNAFEASLKGLRNLKNAGISVHPHATLCQLNLPSLPQMARFAKSLGIDRFSLNMIIPAGRGASEDLAIRYSEVEDIVLRIKSEAKVAGISLMWYWMRVMCVLGIPGFVVQQTRQIFTRKTIGPSGLSRMRTFCYLPRCLSVVFQGVRL